MSEVTEMKVNACVKDSISDCGARQTMELKTKHVGMGKKPHPYPRALPTESEAGAESRLNTPLEKPTTFLLTEQEHHSVLSSISPAVILLPNSVAPKTLGTACFRAIHHLSTPSFVSMSARPSWGAAPTSYSRNGVEVREAPITKIASRALKNFLPTQASNCTYISY